MTSTEAASLAALRLLATTARGSRRDAAFATWLVLRVAEDVLLHNDLPERGIRRRMTSLESRLSSLTVPTGFRRVLGGVISALREPRPEAVRAALTQLAGPAGDLLGGEVAEAIQRLARPVKLA